MDFSILSLFTSLWRINREKRWFFSFFSLPEVSGRNIREIMVYFSKVSLLKDPERKIIEIKRSRRSGTFVIKMPL